MIRISRLLVLLFLCAPQLASADALSSLRLPPVPQAPWRFQEFPIAAWWGPPGTARLVDFQAYKDAGFNLHATNMDIGFDQALAYIEAVGLHAIPLRQPGNFELPPRTSLEPPANHDSIVGWLVNDEPNGDHDVIAAITAVNQLMREDPTRWTFFNMLPPNLQMAPGTPGVIDAAARNGMPILSFDDYVIFADGTERTEQFYRNLAMVRDGSLRHGKPFWAFAVSTQHPGYAGLYRRPSESDLRWMQFSNLAYGAKGLWYFTYWGATTLPRFAHTAIVSNNGAPSELYGMVKHLNQTVLAVGSTLLDLTSTGVFHTNPPGNLPAFPRGTQWISEIDGSDILVGFFKSSSGQPHAMVVNKRHGMSISAAAGQARVRLRFPEHIRSVTALSWMDGATGPLSIGSDGWVELNLAGGTGVLLRQNAE